MERRQKYGKEAIKAAGLQALRTGGKIMTEIADAPQGSAHDIISRNLSDAGQDIIRNLRGGSRRKRTSFSRRGPPRKTSRRRNGKVTKRKKKRAQPIKGDICS